LTPRVFLEAFLNPASSGDTTMEFWRVSQSGEATAAIDAHGGKKWSYADLERDASRIREALPFLGRRSLGFLIANNCYECLAAYLAALNADCALILVDGSLKPALLREVLATYRPDWIHSAQPEFQLEGYRNCAPLEPGLLVNENHQDIEIHSDLALLLTTSGSTGSPKLVRLSARNLAANAESIAQYLQLTSEERPITSLPMSYSYGLSVINSHLQVGATIVFTEDGVLQRGFWEAVDQHQCTSFAGVPYTYEMLLQTGLLNKSGSSLRTLTQAGGRLDERYIQQMYDFAIARDWKFMVMYGQTEATARISYVPFEQLGTKIGSVGVAIPNGMLSVDEGTGELVYRGPNVMLGYAECRDDLAKGDDLRGVLRTGDLARQDGEGYFYITGRLKRFLKLFGKRFNLDDVEKTLSRRFEMSVACYGRDDLLMVAVEHCDDSEAFRGAVCEAFDLPRTAVKVIVMKELPRTINGKLDYQRLADPKGERSTVATA
jgi:long-chain acyl-CoA synthetase